MERRRAPGVLRLTCGRSLSQPTPPARPSSPHPPQTHHRELDGYGLAGELPAGLAALASLRVLDLSNNIFSGALPAGWAALRELRALAAEDSEELRAAGVRAVLDEGSGRLRVERRE